VWGVGVTLFEAATRLRPFAEQAPSSAPSSVDASRPDGSQPPHHCRACGCRTSYRQQTERAPGVAGLRRLPRALSLSIDAALDPDPGNRPTLAELALSMAACL